MTLDELNTIGEVARQKCAREGGSIAAMTRAKTRAMVEALRDEMKSTGKFRSVERAFNEILASDGEVKAAGGDSSGEIVASPAAAPTVGQRLIKAAKEAAAIAKGEKPAAAPVCVWTQYVRGDEPACNPSMTMYEGKAGLPCPRCNRPIKFKEAAR